MKRLLLLVAAVLLTAIPVQPQTKREVYYLIHASRVKTGDRTSETYSKLGLTPIVVLTGNGTNCFTENFDWRPELVQLKAKLNGPFLVALWADNVNRMGKPGGSTFFPYDDEAGWKVLTDNLKRLAAHRDEFRFTGVVWDGEIYTSTKDANGGRMSESKGAYPESPFSRDKARLLAQSLQGVTLGQYVCVSDAKRLKGWSDVWGEAYRTHTGRKLLLDESGYLINDDVSAFRKLGVKTLPGRTIINQSLKGRVPKEDFWLYPWDGDAELTSLSAKWMN